MEIAASHLTAPHIWRRHSWMRVPRVPGSRPQRETLLANHIEEVATLLAETWRTAPAFSGTKILLAMLPRSSHNIWISLIYSCLYNEFNSVNHSYDTLFNAVAIRRSVSRSQLSYISRIKSQATEGMASWSFLGPLGPLGCLSPELQRCCVSIASSQRQARGCVGSLASISWGKRSSLLQEN